MRRVLLFVVFFVGLFCFSTPVHAEYRRSVQAWGFGGNSYTCGAECSRDRLIKLEVSDLNISGSNLRIGGLMYVVQKQNYFNANDHEYLFEVQANGQSAYWKVNLAGGDRTNTHREKNDLADAGWKGVYPQPFCKTWPGGGESSYFPGSTSCDIQYRNVGFSGNIPLNEVYEFLASVGANQATMKMVLQNKMEGSGFNDWAVYYEDIHTVFNEINQNTSDGRLNIKISSSSNNPRGQVIEDNVIIRGESGSPNGGTLSWGNYGGLLPAFNNPGGFNCSRGDATGRMMFTYSSRRAPQTFTIVDCGGEGKYCKNGIPYAEIRNPLGNNEPVSDAQAGYKLRFYCYQNSNTSPIYVENWRAPGTTGEFHGWIAASAFRVTGNASIITVKPNKRVFVDQIVTPTQECAANNKLLLRVRCNPCGDGRDTIRINYGGKNTSVSVTGLTTTPKDILVGPFNGAGCSKSSNRVSISATPDSTPDGGLSSTGYTPTNANLTMSCSQQSQMKQTSEGVVLTKKERSGTYNEYKERVSIFTLKSPGTIKAGMGFEYPVGYQYQVDAETNSYPQLFASGAFSFNPRTKFYASDLSQKLNVAYPKKSITVDNPSAIYNRLYGVFTGNQAYTIPYSNTSVNYGTLGNRLQTSIATGKLLTYNDRVMGDGNNDGIINARDVAYARDSNIPTIRGTVAVLPQTWIEKGSGRVYNTTQSNASGVKKPLEDGGTKFYSSLDAKTGKYYFAVSGDRIGLNQVTFVLPKCAYNITCNPISETCTETPKVCNPAVEVCNSKKCDPSVENCSPGGPGNPENPVCNPKVEDCGAGTKAVFRIISLSDPFPRRAAGTNWRGKERLIKANAYDTQAEYSTTINRARMTNITDYNRNFGYLDYSSLYWDTSNRLWRSTFINNYGIIRG